VAKVQFVADDSEYTGIFKGSDCGLLRLSVTGDPSDRGFAPGLAWKTFVDSKPSENVSALYTLSGQGNNQNFFANELSQYVSPEANETLGTALIFSAVTSKPTRLMVDAMASTNQDGSAASNATSPTQIYFVPTDNVKNKFSTSAHDFRSDLVTLKAGENLYDIYATSERIRTSIFPRWNKRYADKRRNSAKKIGSIKLTSDFKLSDFGDNGIFFKHQRYEDR
jgi:hypothetical protein